MVELKVKARKFLKRYEENRDGKTVEIIENDIMFFDLEFDHIDYFSLIWDDPEDAFYKGMAYDMDNELVWIDVDQFCGSIEDWKEDMIEEQSYEDVDYADEVLEHLSIMRGWTLYFNDGGDDAQ